MSRYVMRIAVLAAGVACLCAPSVASAATQLSVHQMTLRPVSTAANNAQAASKPIAIPFRTKNASQLAAAKQSAWQQYLNSPHPRAGLSPQTSIWQGLSFDGIVGGGANTGFSPPDGGGAIGTTYFVEGANDEVGIYNRTGTLVSSMSSAGFTGLPGPCDPYIMWDSGAQRFVMIWIECDTGTAHSLSIAFTKTTDPTDLTNGWCKYTIDTGTEFPDYPKAGHNNSDWLIGVNDYSTSTGVFDTAEMMAIKKPANGTITSCPLITTDTAGTAASPITANGDTVFTAEPPDTLDSGAPPASGVASDNSSFVAYKCCTGGNVVHAFKFNRDSSGNAHFTFEGDIGITSYAVPANVPQPGTSDVMSSSDTRGIGASGHVDPQRCSGCEAVWVAHTVNGSGGRSQIQWEELNPSACTGSSTCPSSALVQDGLVSDSSLFFFNGRISPTNNGFEAVLNFDAGSSTQLEQIRAISNTMADSAGATHSQATIVTSAAADQDFTCSPCRWGDYAAAEADPLHTDVVWNNSMYNDNASPGTVQWTTRLFAISTGSPEATTDAATSVGATGATLNSTLNPSGNATTYKYEYGTTTSFGTVSAQFNAGSGTSDVAGAADAVSGLTAATTYYYRVCAKNAETGTAQVCGAVTPFTTTGAPAAPSASTGSASGISNTGATLSGTLNAHGAATAYTFEYGTNVFNFGHISSVQSGGSSTADENVTGTISGLNPNTTYFYRLVATNGQGTTNGSVMAFTTTGPPSGPLAATGSATNITATGATLNGTLNPEAQQTSFTFEYGIGTALNHITAVDNAGSFGGYESVSLPASGLSSGTTYCYRLVASNASGTGTGALSCFRTS